jgi:hypothetical protein
MPNKLEPTSSEAANLPRPPQFMTLLNEILDRLWRVGLLPLHGTSEQWLAAMERGAHGAEREFLSDLRHLIESVEPDTTLTMMGRRGLRAVLKEARRHSREVEAAFERHPEISTVPIVRPVFVVGMPRTGTTFLQSLLSQAPGCRCLSPWELERPLPRDRSAWGTSDDPRRRAYERTLQRHRRTHGDMDAIHPLDSPAECWRLLLPTAICHTLFLFFGFQGYPNWAGELMRDRIRAAYSHYRRQLQYLTWVGSSPSHWVLKAPEHAYNLPALLDIFPDACIVVLHRDPLRVVPSFCSLAWRCQSSCIQNPEPSAIGRGALGALARCAEGLVASRETLDASRFFDLQYLDLTGDPLGSVERIYEHFNMAFPDSVRSAMSRWLLNKTQSPRPIHRYDAGDFALSSAEIDRAFAGYRAYFGVAYESAAGLQGGPL